MDNGLRCKAVETPTWNGDKNEGTNNGLKICLGKKNKETQMEFN